jgi:hypothetical protein
VATKHQGNGYQRELQALAGFAGTAARGLISLLHGGRVAGYQVERSITLRDLANTQLQSTLSQFVFRPHVRKPE